jgi:large subunit ribosomal protein L9
MAYMEVLLREDIDNLGDRGQTVRVRRGYGRNYLLPRGLAVEASAASVKQIENEKRVLAKREARDKKAAQVALQSFDGLTLTFERKAGEEGRLFGSVTVLDIVHELEAQGKTVDRHSIRLKDTIKTLGEHEVPVRLHREVIVPLKVVVNPEGGLPAVAAPAAVPAADAAPAPARYAAPEVDEDEDEDDTDE